MRDSGTSNVKLIINIKNKIWLHTNKREFFNKTSIIYYLNKLSNINTTRRDIALTIEKCRAQLNTIRKEIENYERIVDNQRKMSLNLNVSQDIKILKDMRQTPENHDERRNQLIWANSLEETDSLATFSDIVLTNDNFQYSDLTVNPGNDSTNNNKTLNFVNNLNTPEFLKCHPKKVQTISHNAINIGPFASNYQVGIEGNILQNNNSIEAISYSGCDTSVSRQYSVIPESHIIQDSFIKFDKNREVLSDRGETDQNDNATNFCKFQKPSNTCSNVFRSTNTDIISTALSRCQDVHNVSKNMRIDSGLSSMLSTSCGDCNKISKKRKICIDDSYKVQEYVPEVEKDPFLDPEVAQHPLAELNSMINVFKRCILDSVDQILAEKEARKKKVETMRKSVKINPFFINKNNPIPTLVQSFEANEITPDECNLNCDALAFMYSQEYKKLFNSNEEDFVNLNDIT